MEELRLLVPEGYWDQVLVGYYNGGLLLPLSEFFDPSALTPSQALCKMAAATKGEEQIQNLVRQINSRPLQYSLFPRDGISVDTLAASVSKMVHTLELNTELRMVCSGHSVDVIPMTSTKRNVLAAMMSKCQGDPSNAILCIGDKGGQDGNDWDLLGTAFGLSVAEVCDRPEVCWNLLPPPLSGPEGLRYYGQCIQWVGSGFFLFNPT